MRVTCALGSSEVVTAPMTDTGSHHYVAQCGDRSLDYERRIKRQRRKPLCSTTSAEHWATFILRRKEECT
jgi:hypothetical protein